MQFCYCPACGEKTVEQVGDPFTGTCSSCLEVFKISICNPVHGSPPWEPIFDQDELVLEMARGFIQRAHEKAKAVRP